MMKKRIIISAIVAVALTALLFGIINVAALDVRTDPPYTVTTTAGSPGNCAFVSSTLEGVYPVEWPGPSPPPQYYNTYECANLWAERGSSNSDIAITGNFWIHFYSNGHYVAPQWIADTNVDASLGCHGDDEVYGYAGTWIYYIPTQQTYWIEADNMIQAHYP